MALILAIETATKLCSVALARDGKLLAIRESDPTTNAHAEKVNVFIKEVMQEAGCALSELDAVAVGIGPGSYTGLRIGLSAAKGLCYALDIPVIGVSTLGTLAQGALENSPVRNAELWPMVDARRMEVFAQPYSSELNPKEPAAPLILDREWAQRPVARMVFGDGADKAAELWNGNEHITFVHGITPSAKYMFNTAEKRYAIDAFDDLAYLVPDYGKAANVGMGKKP